MEGSVPNLDPLVWRTATRTSPAGSFGYNYLVGGNPSPSPLVRKLTLPNTSYIDYGYDNVARGP